METRRPRNFSEDCLTVSRRSKKTTENERENSLPIPIDLIIEIFSRLSSKSIARCRCVSKPWSSILCSSDFTELFLTRSSARPQLLIVCQINNEFFFSSLEPQNPDDNSSPLVVNYHMKFSFDGYYYSPICRLVHGLVSLINQQISQGVRSLLGYHPIDKQFKLLSMKCYGVNKVHEKHKVLTLGTGNHSWRRIKCCKQHYAWKEDICIDGVLYYTASDNISSKASMVTCFDIRSEKFKFFKFPETFTGDCLLINCNGKLGFHASSLSWIDGNSRSIELHVLEDTEKQEWSKHTYVLHALRPNIVGNKGLHFVGDRRSNYAFRRFLLQYREKDNHKASSPRNGGA